MNKSQFSLILVGLFVLSGTLILDYNRVIGLMLLSCAIGLLLGIVIFDNDCGVKEDLGVKNEY